VLFVVGDFIWRPSLLLGFIFVFASSCLCFGVDKVFRVCPFKLSIFCVLDFDGPVNFASRSELMSSCKIVWLAMVLQDGATKGIGAGLTVSCSCH
jgi:hypothetical protein